MSELNENVPPTPPSIGGSEVKKLGYSLYLRIPDDRLECRCSYVPHDQGSMITRDEFIAFLKQYSVNEGINYQVLDDFIVKASAGQQQVDVLVASGIPPVTGADEYLNLAITPSTKVHEDDETGTNVDMYIVQTFINVTSGDEIGRIIPAEPGVPGRTISGIEIPPTPGKPLNITIGKNIKSSEDGSCLFATATGRFCQSADEISVEEEYIVKGDVNFRVGSINFKGIVEVRGDVLDNFDITASKGLTVTGNIGVCNIISDCNITFCGMDGQDKAKIVCGGSLHAHFIHDVDVECAGDVIVDVEIHNCNIRTLGRVVVDKGAISGGSCIAKGGIEAKKLGSAASTHTKLQAGVDYRDISVLEDLYAKLSEVQEKLKQTPTLTEIVELRKIAAALTDNIMAVRSKSDEITNAKINAKTVLYENVHLTLGTVTESTTNQKDGGCSLIENTIEGGLRYLSMTSLNVKAINIEQAFVMEEKKKLQKG